MNNENRETIADILAEMRDFANGQEKNHCYDLRLMGTDSLRAYADRIEAAHISFHDKYKEHVNELNRQIIELKGENKTIKESLIVGDAAAMLAALLKTQSVIAKCMEILNKIPGGVEYDGLIDDVADEICDLRDSYVNPALSAPPRNCDVGTANEQIERHEKWCNSDRCVYKNCGECFAEWSQMTYKEGVKK